MPAGLDKPCKLFRSGIATSTKARVDRAGGKFGAGLIRDVAVITRGEALGHGGWIDEEFLSSVVEAITTSPAENGGVKARLTHPGLSADGITDRLGRVTDGYMIGHTVYGDLHIMQAAHNTPDGDKASYVMDLAEEDPDSFGLSIVFESDYDAEEQFVIEHSTAHGNKTLFVSPDEMNKNNLPHFRLSRLRGADVVDDPAANPDGLFSATQSPALEAEALLSYVLGLSAVKPETQFGVEPDRVARFFANFLARHALTIRTDDMAIATKTDEASVAESTPVVLSREDFARELSRFTDAFGSDYGVKWFNANHDYDTAAAVFAELNKAAVTLQAEVSELKNRLAALDTGDTNPISLQDGDAVVPKRSGMAGKIRLSGKRYANN